MKKFILILEIIFVTALLLAVIALCVGIPLGLPIPGMTPKLTEPSEATTLVTEPAETTPTEATEPPETTEPPFQMPEISWKTLPEDREMTAARAFVYDCQSQSYLYVKGDSSEKLFIASITKLFTAHVVVQYLDPQQTLTMTQEVLDMVPADSSTAKLELGDVLTVAQLIEGMMLPSGNDAAKLLAVEVGRKAAGDTTLTPAAAIEAFVAEMNYQAQALGLTGTHFANPDGYHDDNHYSCFDDLVTIAKLALVNETIMNCSTLPEKHIVPVVGEEKDWINTNFLVNPAYEYYCPYAIGLKTGQTDAAGKCQLSAFDFEGHEYIIGVFGSAGFNERLDDTLQLLNAKVMQQSNP